MNSGSLPIVLRSWMAHAAVLVFAFAVVGCSGAGVASEAPESPASQKADPTSNDAQRDRCRRLAPDPVHLAVADASSANMTPTSVVSEAARLLDEALACYHAEFLPDDDYARVLLSIRQLIQRWYDSAPPQRALALSGDRSGLLPVANGLEVLPHARGLAEYYLYTEIELQRVGTPIQLIAGESRLRDALMLVDAATGVLANLLDQQVPSGTPTIPIELAVEALGRGLFDESATWSRDEIPRPGGASAASYISKLAPGEPLRFEARILFVSAYINALGRSWGTRSNDGLRDALGRPYGAYLQTLYDAVNRVEPQKDFQWVVPVEVLEEGRYRHINRVRLDRMVRETLFDNYNVRAFFAVREAEADWQSFLDPERRQPVTDGEIIGATYKLLNAARLTDSVQSRLGAIARVLLVANVRDGRGGTAVPTGPVAGIDPRGIGQQRASRQLAELSLCVLNDGFLDGGGRPLQCTVGLDPRSRSAPSTCDATPLSPEFAATRSRVPTITEEARKGYESLIAAIDLNWHTPVLATPGEAAALATEPPVATSCELARLFHAVALGRLAVGTSTYQAVIELISTGRVSVTPMQIGPLLSLAVASMLREQQGVCSVVGVTRCGLDDMNRALTKAAPGRATQINQAIDLYCEITLTGADIVDGATRPGRGPTMLQRSEAYLSPLNADAMRGIVPILLAEAAACRVRSP